MKEDPKITPVQNIWWTETKKTEIIVIIISQGSECFTLFIIMMMMKMTRI